MPTTGIGALSRNADGHLLVQIRVSSTRAAVVARLRRLGAQVVSITPGYNTVTARVAPRLLGAIGADPAVQYVSEVLAPQVAATPTIVPNGQSVAAGGVCAPTVSEGDSLMNVAAARAANGIDGSGQTVGLLSDSFDTWVNAPTRAAQDVATGDLPGPGNPCGYTTPVAIGSEYNAGGQQDEGRALAQLAHGLAPGAHLAFTSAENGDLDFADQITALRTTHRATVLVDDLEYPNEPFFQDGPIANAANAASAAGVPYFSAAGNANVIVNGHNVSSYEAPSYRPTTCPAAVTSAELVVSCHDFDPTGGADNGDAITLAPGGGFALDFQWAQPWNGVATDYDVFVLDDSGSVVASSTTRNFNSQQPFEFLGYTNSTGTARTFSIVIAKESGTTDARLKFVFVGSGGITGVEYNASTGGDTVGPTIFGHSGADTVGSTAAVPFDNSNQSEDFSSRGPVTHYFAPTGGGVAAAPLAVPDVANKPDFAATDGVQNTFFGEQAGSTYRFFGTSASAPQAAAIGALLLERDPALTSAQVMATLASTARPVTTNGTADAVGGGYLDAAAALADVVPLPGVPGGVVADNGNTQATIHWTAAATNPNFPVTGYAVTPVLAGVAQTAVPFAATATSGVVEGLTNGGHYTFLVTASNANGAGPPSAPSAAIDIGVLSAPTALVVTPGNGQVQIRWSAPPAISGLPPTGYVVTPIINGVAQSPHTLSGSATTETIGALANGKLFSFKVAAIDAVAVGPTSAESTAVSVGAAVAPGKPSVDPRNGGVELRWTAPTTDNGSAITAYRLTPYQDGFARPVTFVPAPATSGVANALNGLPVTFTVEAQNARGFSPLSASSAVVIPGTPSAPAAPTALSNSGSATVQWVAPLSNGFPITGYTVTAFVGFFPVLTHTYGPATSEVFTGLTNATTYRFTVSATNTNGTGPASPTGPPITIGAPAAPTATAATPGPATTTTGSLTVAFSAGANNGASITKFTASCTSSNGGVTGSVFGATGPLTVTGLTTAKTYTCTVTATNARGTGLPSAPSHAATIGAPAAPTAPTAISGDARATVAWVAPNSNGSAITGYTVTAFVGFFPVLTHAYGTATTEIVTGLTNATTYRFTVSATNANGNGAASPTGPAITIGAPTAPTKVRATPLSTTTATGSLSVAFTAGANNGAAITSYTATCTSGNGGATGTASGATSALTVTGLTTAKTYTCTVTATNARGRSLSSVASAAINVGAPGAPTSIVVAKVASGSIKVTFAAAANNGAAITKYTATCSSSNGGLTGSAFGAVGPLTVTALTTTKSYACTVRATNARGTGLPSVVSASVTA